MFVTGDCQCRAMMHVHFKPHVLKKEFLPPTTKLGQGNIFRSVCQEFCTQGGGVVHGREHAWDGACVACVACVAWQGAYMAGLCVWQGEGMHVRYYEIRSMSRRYASYRNPFLCYYSVCSFISASEITRKLPFTTNIKYQWRNTLFTQQMNRNALP